MYYKYISMYQHACACVNCVRRCCTNRPWAKWIAGTNRHTDAHTHIHAHTKRFWHELPDTTDACAQLAYHEYHTSTTGQGAGALLPL